MDSAMPLILINLDVASTSARTGGFGRSQPMNDKIKAVLVGCGSISGSWIRPAKNIPELELVGLVDIVEEQARKRAVKFDLPHAAIGTDLAAMLAVTRPDVVFDCTVPEAHMNVTLQALAHGCHVLG